MGSSSSPQTTTQNATSTTAPWDPQQSFLLNGFNAANNDILNSGLSPQEQQALQNAWANYSNMNPTEINQAGANAANFKNSAPAQWEQQYLNNDPLKNPSTDPTYQAAKNSIIPDVASKFSTAGAFNSSAAQNAATSALSDAFAKENTANNQIKSGVASSLQSGQMANNNLLSQIPGLRQQFLTNQTQGQLNTGAYARNTRIQQIMDYLKAVGGNYGGSTTSSSSGTQTPASGTNWGQLLSGAGLLAASFI